MKKTYAITDVAPYINWVYFYFAWGIHNKPEAEKQKLRQEAEAFLDTLANRYHTHALFELFDAHSDGDDVVVSAGGGWKVEGGERIPLLRQQQAGSDFLCLADYIQPQNISPIPADAPTRSLSTLHLPPSSKIGIFATTVDIGLETDFASDPYAKMMAQLLADRLAEATAERLHEEVRKHYWGYAPDEHLSIADMLVEKFQGIRPAVGYPSLPDTSLNFVIDGLLGLKQIGIRLTESGAMKPHASVSGFMFSHPQARYFSLGKIGEDQLSDYARRRGLPVEVCRKFLSVSL